MSNTSKGGQTLRESNIKKYGTYEKYVEYMHAISSRGGSKLGVEKGFAARPDLAAACGKIGGRISRRRPKAV